LSTSEDHSRTREQLENELLKSEKQFRAVFDNALDAILIADDEGRYLDANPAACSLLGLTKDEIIGRHVSDFTAAGHTAEVTQQWKLFLAEGSQQGIFELSRPDATTLTVDFAAKANILPGRHLSILRDITERKRAVAALHQAEHRAIREYKHLLHRLTHLAEAFGSARDLITVFRALRDFSTASVPCIGIFISLYDAPQDVRTAAYAWGDGEEIDVSTLPPMPITTEGPNSRAVRTGQIIVTDDFPNVKHGARPVSVGPNEGVMPQSSLVAPMAVMGRIVGTVEVQSYEPAAYKEEHVTSMRMAANLAAVAIENVRLLEHERRARGVAEESNRIKDEFLATLSHELRTPLTAVLGWARMLRSDALDSTTRDHALEIIERNARAQTQIIEDILDVSRIITGKTRIDARPIELEPIIKNAIDAVRPAAEAKKIELRLESQPTVAIVSGDPDRLQQVIWNLLSNAVKFTHTGGSISISLRHEASHVRLEVSDTGDGITPDFLPFIFDRFRQADGSSTRAHGGLGIGLSIVRHLVELHGGTVQAESEGVGRGSKFSVRLPLVAYKAKRQLGRNAAASSLPDDVELATIDLQSLRGLRVLVVDDEPDALEYLSATLKGCGAHVTAVASASEALDALDASSYDALVSDIGMPGVDGYELIRKVREMENNTESALPAIALTAYARFEDRTRALAAGFQQHLPKPFEPSELTTILATLAKNRAKH
jgi:PAS domain S-box-containing protein